MPLPYNRRLAGLLKLIELMTEGGEQIGGTAGCRSARARRTCRSARSLAIIEQPTKVENAVHKRMHASQAEELQLLVECFREHPESFVRHSHPSDAEWTEQSFLAALNDHDLVPQADPNTASHLQRMAKGMGLLQLSATAPTLYDPIAVHKFALQSVLGFAQPDQFMVPPAALAATPPDVQEKEAKAQADQAKSQSDNLRAQAAMITAQAKAAQVQHEANQPGEAEGPDPAAEIKARASLMDAQTRQKGLGIEVHKIAENTRNEELNRQAEHRSNLMDLAKAVIGHEADARLAAQEVGPIEKKIEGEK